MENEDLANDCDISKKIKPKPPATAGGTWFIGWAPIETRKILLEKSFEEVNLDKMKGPTQKEQTKRKNRLRRKVGN